MNMISQFYPEQKDELKLKDIPPMSIKDINTAEDVLSYQEYILSTPPGEVFIKRRSTLRIFLEKIGIS